MQAAPLLGRCLAAAVAEDRHEAAEMLLDELARDDAADQLPRAAVFHGVTGRVHHHAENTSLSPSIKADLRHAYQASVANHLRSTAALRWVASVLETAGVPWLTYKGPVLNEVVYRRPDERDYVDIDILVPGGGLGRALEHLEDAGCTLLEHGWRRLLAERPGELNLALPDGTLADLHWHVLYNPRLRRQFNVPTGELLQRRQWVDVKGASVPTLDELDTLIVVALHACRTGGHRLVWLKDVEQLVLRSSLDWDALVTRSRTAGAARAVATVLLRARDVLGLSVPDDVLAVLAGSRSWTRLVEFTQMRFPVERATAGASPVRVVSRAAHDGTVACGVELVGGLASWGRRRLTERARTAIATSPWDEARFHPLETDGDRVAFLRYVASAD
jgi:hypothetical protein